MSFSIYILRNPTKREIPFDLKAARAYASAGRATLPRGSKAIMSTDDATVIDDLKANGAIIRETVKDPWPLQRGTRFGVPPQALDDLSIAKYLESMRTGDEAQISRAALTKSLTHYVIATPHDAEVVFHWGTRRAALFFGRVHLREGDAVLVTADVATREYIQHWGKTSELAPRELVSDALAVKDPWPLPAPDFNPEISHAIMSGGKGLLARRVPRHSRTRASLSYRAPTRNAGHRQGRRS